MISEPSAFGVRRPQNWDMPFVFNVPHSGRFYSRHFLQQLQVPQKALRHMEDAFVDKLFACVPQMGAALMWARFPRVYIDLNRAPEELDPDMLTTPPPFLPHTTEQVVNGHGLITRRTCEGHLLYPKRLHWNEVQFRLDHFYRPYHRALQKLLEDVRNRFKKAILIDCHSMPSMPWGSNMGPDMVLGNRFGQTASEALTACVETTLKSFGYTVVRNKPYAGGFITAHYAKKGYETLQIEISRPLYMNQETVACHHGFGRVARHMEAMVRALSTGYALAAQ